MLLNRFCDITASGTVGRQPLAVTRAGSLKTPFPKRLQLRSAAPEATPVVEAPSQQSDAGFRQQLENQMERQRAQEAQEQPARVPW